jgi:hypothetical protein
MRLNNAEANLEVDSEQWQLEQEEERERAKNNALNVKNSTVSENRLEVNDFCFLSVFCLLKKGLNGRAASPEAGSSVKSEGSHL